MVAEKNIHLESVSLMKAHNLSVSLTIPFSCSQYAVNMLKSFNPCDENKKKTMYEGYAEGAVAYALFLLIKEKLIGSAVDGSRSKADHVTCNAHDGDFVVSWNTQGTGTMLRKTVGVALKALLPNSLYSRYGYCIKLLGGKADRAEFDFLAGKMIDAIEKGVYFVAVGKIKPDVDLKGILEVAAKKYVKSKKAGGKAPEKHPEVADSAFVLKCDNGASAVIVADYIMHSVPLVYICGKHLKIYAGNWGSKHESLKDKSRIAGYCKTKYEKLGKDAGAFLAFTANSQALSSGANILNISRKSDMKSVIAGNL